MATNKPHISDEDALVPQAGGDELNQAIDDLRGVLKADSSSDFGGFGDFSASGAQGEDPLSAFGDIPSPGAGEFGDFSADESFGASTASFEAQTSRQAGSALTANLDMIMDIPIDLQIVLGTSRLPVSGLMNLEEGATIALDKKIGEPVEIMVNGRRIGRGEITVLENDDTRFGVKLTEVMSTKKT